MRATPLLALVIAGVAYAQPPAGYYNSVNPANAATLRATLHVVIDDHVEFPYTASATDTWDVLEAAQQDPNNSSRILDVYRNASYQKQGGGNGLYNREHAWPKSYGFPDQVNYGAYTDCHQLWLSDDGYNSARSNKPFGICLPSHSEYTTLVNNGSGGGAGVFPGNSNWTDGSFASGHWQVWSGRKGDLARAMFYMDLRYEGGSHSITGRNEPDLILTNDRALIDNSNTGQVEPIAYMGLLDVLLQWHLEDPPDAYERRRNDVVFGFQGNRNPFVDHPEWVGIVWGVAIPGSVTRFGTGCRVGALPDPVFSVPTAPSIGQNLTMSTVLAPTSAPAALHIASTSTSVDLALLGFVGCTLLVPPVAVVTTTTSLAGTASTTVQVANDPNIVGAHVFAQWLIIDLPNLSIATTEGVDLVIGG